MHRTSLNTILLVVIMFFTSACGGNLFADPTSTSTPTNTPDKQYGNTQSFMVSGTKRSDISR